MRSVLAMCALLVHGKPPHEPPLGCPDGARTILMDLWDATEGPTAWRDTEGWATAAPCCGWHGVTCDANSSAVTKLRLVDNRMRGTLVRAQLSFNNRSPFANGFRAWWRGLRPAALAARLARLAGQGPRGADHLWQFARPRRRLRLARQPRLPHWHDAGHAEPALRAEEALHALQRHVRHRPLSAVHDAAGLHPHWR